MNKHKVINLGFFFVLLSILAYSQSKPPLTRVYSIAASPDKSLLISGDASGYVKVWDIQDGKLLKNIKSHDRPIRFVDFIDDSTFVGVSMDGRILTGNVLTGRSHVRFKLLGNPSNVYEAFYSEKAKVLGISNIVTPSHMSEVSIFG